MSLAISLWMRENKDNILKYNYSGIIIITIIVYSKLISGSQLPGILMFINENS